MIVLRFHLFLSLILLIFINGVGAQENWSPENVYYGKGGKLTYTPDELGNVIPDFSHVGYRYGDVPIPDVATVVEVSPVDGDDGATIQAAINSLYNITPDENGFRGAVLLKKGIYRVAGQIRISASGIVLRGEGDAEDGTVIIAEGTSDRELIKIDNGASRSVNSSSRVTIAEDYVPVGRKYVIVNSASGFSKGDQIVLYRPASSQWISDIKMNQITPSEGTVQWTASGYSFYFERLVTKVNGDTLFFRNPVVMAMEKRYGGGFVYKFTFNRLQNIGIEDMRLKSAFSGNQDEAHSWRAIKFYSVEHSWTRNLTSFYFAYSCVHMTNKSRLITVENCHSREPKSIITGGRRYSFDIDGSLCLVKNCTTTEGRHDYVNGARVTGPNVFTGSTAVNTHSDIGPHHRWAMGTMFDKITSTGTINVQDRDDMGTGHGWSGANTVFWNCEGNSSICESPWTSAKNYNFGFIGQKKAGYRPGRPDGEWVGHNVPGIFPVSLYEAQLDERLNGTTLFSAVPFLTQINDTSFAMQFSFPLDTVQIKNENFQITAAIEIANHEFTVTQTDEYTVVFSSPHFFSLPDLSTLLIKADQLTSENGKQIEGVVTASFTMGKRGPEVTGQAKITDNVSGFGEASSNKPGYIYLVKYGVNATTITELDSLVTLNLGRKTEVTESDIIVSISAKGLPGGYYQYYAVDNDGRVSSPSSTWIILDELGPVTGLEVHVVKNDFKVFQQNEILIVDPVNETEYSLAIYSLTGQLMYRNKFLYGIQTIHLKGNKDVIIIKLVSGEKTNVVKLLTNSAF
jgi:hypothetical protein